MDRERVTNLYPALVLDISPLAERVHAGDRPREMSRRARISDPNAVRVVESSRIRVYPLS